MIEYTNPPSDSDKPWQEVYGEMAMFYRTLYAVYTEKSKGLMRPYFEELVGRPLTDAEFGDLYTTFDRKLTEATIHAILYGD